MEKGAPKPLRLSEYLNNKKMAAAAKPGPAQAVKPVSAAVPASNEI
jgi:hypothetical protein